MNNIALPLPKTEFFKRSLLYSGPILWNSLPTDIRNCTCLSNFKSCFKNYLLNNQ